MNIFKKWNRDVRTGGLGITPGMDTIAMLIMCWALAPVDIFLTWIRVYKEAEEARRRQSNITLDVRALRNEGTHIQ